MNSSDRVSGIFQKVLWWLFQKFFLDLQEFISENSSKDFCKNTSKDVFKNFSEGFSRNSSEDISWNSTKDLTWGLRNKFC